MDYGGLYEQLASKKFREILISQIRYSSLCHDTLEDVNM